MDWGCNKKDDTTSSREWYGANKVFQTRSNTLKVSEYFFFQYVWIGLTILNYSLLKHPNIVQFLGWCHPQDSNYILIVEGIAFYSINWT